MIVNLTCLSCKVRQFIDVKLFLRCYRLGSNHDPIGGGYSSPLSQTPLLGWLGVAKLPPFFPTHLEKLGYDLEQNLRICSFKLFIFAGCNCCYGSSRSRHSWLLPSRDHCCWICSRYCSFLPITSFY